MPRSSKRYRVPRGAARRAVRSGHVSDNFAVARRFDLMADVLGVRIAIATDAHTLDDLDCIALGVATARRQVAS